MSKKDLINSLRCGLFASRPSIEEAYDYALDVLGRDAQALTAIHVLMNAIADRIEEKDIDEAMREALESVLGDDELNLRHSDTARIQAVLKQLKEV